MDAKVKFVFKKIQFFLINLKIIYFKSLTTKLKEDFKNRLKTCKHLVILTGAGISAGEYW